MSETGSEHGPERPRVLLLGDPSARPYGMERALSRAGFHVAEAASPGERPAPPAPGAPAAPPDVALISAPEADAALATLLQALHAAWGGQVPLVVLLGSPDREGPTRALAMGADDALASPVHPPELCARVDARARGRGGARGPANGRVREALLDLIEEARVAQRTPDLLETLTARLARMLPRWESAVVAASEGDVTATIVAGSGGATSRDVRLELERYPEIVEVLRTARPVIVEQIHADPLFDAARRRWAYQHTAVPVQSVAAFPLAAGERVLGALLLRTRHAGTRLSAADEAFVAQLARAAARVLEAERRVPPSAGTAECGVDALTGVAAPDALDRRVEEESARAKRYSLTFSLVLLDVDEQEQLNERLGRSAGDRLLAEMGRMLQREVRASDFVARYGGDEFALVLAETASEGARDLVQRIRQRLEADEFAGLPPGERPRVSAGIVAFPHPAVQDTGDLMLLLEAALRRGKAQGEERIGVAD
ncbi:MAG TPA: diguanylate cyclase [Gemmatimonadales bacterium]|nr:diguanylate cyclase [Gemmatimonadales bacterium]